MRTFESVMTLSPSIVVFSQVYRRFQISFQSISEASDFIDSIRPVCPCKINPLNVTQGISQTPGLMPAQRPRIWSQSINTSAATSILPARGPVLPAVPAILNSGQINFTATAAAHKPASAFALSSSPLNHQPLSEPQSSLGLNIANSLNSSPIFAPAGPISASNHSLLQAPQSTPNNFSSHNADNVSATSISCLSSSLPVTSSEQSSDSSGQPPNTAQSLKRNSTQQSANAILASITETASVYDLPVSSLERLVGDIIREDGFIQLVYTFFILFHYSLLTFFFFH